MRAFCIKEQDVEPIKLPGRNWKMLINETVGCKNITFGLAEFPAGSNPGSHKHDVQEEIIFILEGKGRMTFGQFEQEEIKLAPGVAVYIPPGIEHAVINDGDKTIRLITLFSPQVIPGSYDKK
ncbi:MAG: cupin domain-containing protein [Peptococcaceae bacterium]|jgi:putative monooxygenase|nr:cupin domain-containing protein [Peptococcaceae bacterium]MDH7525488.1 cupin domain-containing protein [Peptococcaceae bacterium]